MSSRPITDLGTVFLTSIMKTYGISLTGGFKRLVYLVVSAELQANSRLKHYA